MSSFGSDGSIRCWMCKKNGENRFFAGYAARKVHEDTVHASKYSLDDYTKIDKDYYSYENEFLSSNISFGARSSDSEYQTNNVTYARKGKLCYKQFENLKQRFQVHGTERNISSNRLAKCEQWLDNKEDVRQYERESFNIRLQQALGEIESKKALVKQLQADLDRGNMKLTEQQARERQLQDQIEVIERDLKSTLHELQRTAGVIEHERDQRAQMQHMLESRLNSQKMHIAKLQEELDNERLIVKQNERDLDELVRLERKMRQVEKELAMEKRLKLEAKKSQQECQSEVDELINENKDIRKRLRQCHQDLEQLQDEQKYLIADYNAMMDTKENQEFEEQILEAQQLVADKFKEERVHLAREIEKYQQLNEASKNKLKLSLAELEQVRFELANVESYRQDDIDRLLKDKDCLKMDLKQKKAKLQSLETSNEKLVSQLNTKKRQIKRLQKINGNGEECDEIEVDEEPQQKNLLVDQLESKIRELENLLHVERSYDSEKEDKVKADLNNAIAENSKLEQQLQQIKSEQPLKGNEDANLKTRNEELKRELQKVQQKFENESKGFQDFLENSKKDQDQFEFCLDEIAAENKSLREELQKSIDDATCREAKIGKLKTENEKLLEKLKIESKQDEFEKFHTELAEQKNRMAIILKQKHELEESFEEEKRDLNEKLDQVLETNVEFEKDCIAFESTIEEKENQIKSLQESIKGAAEKNATSYLLENENKTLVSNLEDSRIELYRLTLKIQEMEKDLKSKQTETDQMKYLEREIERIEEEKESSKIHAAALAEKIERLRIEISSAEEDFQREKKELVEELEHETQFKTELEKQNLELQSKIDLKDVQENGIAEKQRELGATKEELEAAKTKVNILTDNLKDSENNCNKLKRDLKSRKEEIKQSEAKGHDLFKKWKEREKFCFSLESKLSDIEEQLRESESLRNCSEKQVFDLQSKHEETLKKNEQDLERSQLKIDELKKVAVELEKEKRQLREDIAKGEKHLAPQANQVGTDYDMAKELEELRQNLENLKGREKQIQKHNYEMMKKLEVEENLQQNLQEQIDNLKAELQAKHAERITHESKIQMLKEEIHDWERKFDDLGSTLADTQANLQAMSEKSAKAERDNKKENKDLMKDLEKLQFQVKEKEAENILLLKQHENHEELSVTLEKRNAEINSKNEFIQDIDRKNRCLNAEVRKFEKVVRELEDKLEMLEGDKDVCQQDKYIYERQLEEQKEISHRLERTEKDLERAYEDINVLAAEKKELLIKVEELKKTVDGPNEKQMPETTKCCEQMDESYEYESDFEDDVKSSGSENADKGDSCPLPNDEIIGMKEEVYDGNASEQEVNFDDDDDDICDMLVKKPQKQRTEDRCSKTSTSYSRKDTEDSQKAVVWKRDPENDKVSVVKHEELSDDQEFKVKEEDERSIDEENVTEDITIDEDHFLNHVYELEYFEHVKPLGDDKKVENRAADINGDTEVEDMDDEFEEIQTEEEVSATKKQDGESKIKKCDRQSKHVNCVDEEDDILSSFVAKQKSKATKSSNATLKEEQMANELGFEDDLGIEDLIADIAINDESDDQVKKASPKKVRNSTKEKDPNHSDFNSDSETGIKSRQSGFLCNPALSSSKPLGRNLLLPTLGTQTLPPLRGTLKPSF